MAANDGMPMLIDSRYLQNGSGAPGVVCRAVPDPDLAVPPFESPYTAPDIPLDYKQQHPGGTEPEQVAIFPASRNGSSVFVRYILPPGALQEGPPVLWGAASQGLVHRTWPSRHTTYTFGEYTSGRIFFTLLGPLVCSTAYQYQVEGRPALFNFTSLPCPGDDALHLAFVGDVGQTVNSTLTLRNVMRSDASLVLFAGDVTYADRYPPPCYFPGRGGPRASGDLKECGIGGVRWDSWGRMAEDTFSRKLAAFVPGNHELEYTPEWGEMTPFKAYQARTPGLLDDVRAAGLSSGAFPCAPPLFYSLDTGPAHVIGLSSYSPFAKYSHQRMWLEDDLCSVNRTETPWLIVFMHVPLYNTNIGHYMEGEAMRLELEDIFHEAGVDLVVAGHTHAYERSHPVFRMRRAEDGCAATYVTVGDGGNIERVDGPFLEPRPSYSATNKESFGHAELQIFGKSLATYTWYQNEDDNQLLKDQFSLKNQFRSCPRRKPSFC